jgi:beta-lactamase class A
MNSRYFIQRKKVRILLIALLCSTSGFFLGYELKPQVQNTNSQAIRETTDKYTFIHPLLALGRPDIEIPSPQYASLAKRVSDFIEQKKMAKDLTTASVYFINYGKSGSFAINEKEQYAPASMLKVVIMVAYFKKSETDPSILKQTLVYTPSLEKSLEPIPFQQPAELAIGQSYSVETLINKMIIDSDNGAMNTLLANIDDDYITEVYTELGLAGPEANSTYTISSKNYSLFFRILYNATYLSDVDSEKALAILSKAKFKNGLVAGLPEGTLIAHKFGEHVATNGPAVSAIELHDCGIIYGAGGPYLLCVMTRGKDVQTLSSVISDISKLVHEGVSSVK